MALWSWYVGRVYAGVATLPTKRKKKKKKQNRFKLNTRYKITSVN